MGGDDLGSDDEYLTAPITGNVSSDDESSEAPADISSNKRELDDDEAQPKKKRRKKLGGSELRQLGIDIINSPADVQAKLLSEFSDVTFRQNQIAMSSAADSPSLMKRIQGIVSKKKLKKWNQKLSPMVIIVCLSARRAVHVLKELAPFNIRAAKLFAKHITIEDQKAQMESSSFGFAVGTPHRILTLARQGAISFNHTQCVVLDTFVNTKRYSVYTLPDTAPYTQDLLNEYIAPQCKDRKDIRVAFL